MAFDEDDNDDFGGIDDAQVEDRNPKPSPNGEFLFEILKCKLIDGNEGGQTFVMEFKVLESNRQEDPEGSLRTVTITGLNGPKKSRTVKLAKVKTFLAAAMKKDEKQPLPAPMTWGKIANKVGKAEFFDNKGIKVRCTTGAVKVAKESQKPYTPTTFKAA